MEAFRIEPNLNDQITVVGGSLRVKREGEEKVFSLSQVRFAGRVGKNPALWPELVGDRDDEYLVWRRFLYPSNAANASEEESTTGSRAD